MAEIRGDKRFWKLALWFGYVMLCLYGLELGKTTVLVFSASRVPGYVTHRRDASGSCEIGYRFEWQGRTREEAKRYRWPETLFLTGISEGQPTEILVSGFLPFLSVPRALIFPEVLYTLLWSCLAMALVLTARRQNAILAL